MLNRLVLVLAVVNVSAAPAFPQSSAADDASPSTFDRIWRFAELYRNDGNRVVQRVQLSGRYQHDFALVDAEQGKHDEWNVRRMRIGPRIALLRHFQFSGEFELNPQERDPLYVRLTDFYVQWSRRSALVVTVGKQGVPFTMDGSTSSKELIAIDRSNLANNMWFPQEYLPGISVSGRRAPWVYRVGVYTAGEATREFGRFSGSYFTLAALGYDFAEALGVEEALVSGNYVYQPADRDNTFTRRLDHVASIHVNLEAARWGLRADVTGASGYLGQPDLWGVMAMPYVNATRALQLVGRYTQIASDRPNGVQLATYENRVVSGRGDRYTELYLGANYYFYGHKLKFQTGVQLGDMDDLASDGGAYSGVSWTSGFRIGWP